MKINPKDYVEVPLDKYWDEFDGIGYYWFKLKPGVAVAQHVHEFDHTTFILGEVDLYINDEESIRVIDSPVLVRSGARHKIIALLPSWVLCVHNLHGKDKPSIIAPPEF